MTEIRGIAPEVDPEPVFDASTSDAPDTSVSEIPDVPVPDETPRLLPPKDVPDYGEL